MGHLGGAAQAELVLHTIDVSVVFVEPTGPAAGCSSCTIYIIL